MMRVVKALSCAVVAFSILAACGGGGCNPCEPDQRTPQVDCSASAVCR
jgi:hypothetical protein